MCRFLPANEKKNLIFFCFGRPLWKKNEREKGREKREIYSLVVFVQRGRHAFFCSFAGKNPTHADLISALFFFNNNNTYYTHTHTQRALFLSLDDDENDNKRRSVLFLRSLRFRLEVYVFGAENDSSRSGNRVRTKRFFSLFVLRSETLITLWLLAAVSLFH